MFLNITGLTEKGKEIRGSGDRRLGRIYDILKNTIIMETEGKEREVFFLPSNLIYNIHRKTVYLNLDDLEFKKWLRKEGPRLKAEHPAKLKNYFAINEEDIERIDHKIEVAFEENFSDNYISSALENDTCPYCRSAISGSDRLTCSECGLSYALEKKVYTFTERSRTTLHDLQWGLRLSLPYTVNEMLNPEEWVYHRSFLAEPGYLVRTKDSKQPIREIRIVTSHRFISFEMGGGEKHSWEIPIEKITGINLLFPYYERDPKSLLVQFLTQRADRYSAIEIRYQAHDKTKIKRILNGPGNLKDYFAKFYFLDRYMRIQIDKIDSDKRVFSGPKYAIHPRSDLGDIIKERLNRPCPHCNKEIKKMALICPKCDSDAFFVDKQLQRAIIEEPPSELFICPYCNSRMKLGGKFCAECKAEIDQTFSVFLPLITRMETGEVEIIEPVPVLERKCRGCGFQSPVGAKFCINCGRATPTKRVCPYCGHEYSIKLKACTRCGRSQ